MIFPQIYSARIQSTVTICDGYLGHGAPREKKRKDSLTEDENKCMQGENNKRNKTYSTQPASDALAGNWNTAFITYILIAVNKELHALIYFRKEK